MYLPEYGSMYLNTYSECLINNTWCRLYVPEYLQSCIIEFSSFLSCSIEASARARVYLENRS